MKILTYLLMCFVAACACPSVLVADETDRKEQLASKSATKSTVVEGFSIAEGDHGVTIMVDGKPFASYVVDDVNKPYFWPIVGPTGKPMTRAFPMQKVPGESSVQRDHPHHRGITFGHESIVGPDQSGGDSWHEWITFGGLRQGPGNNPDSDQRISTIASIKHLAFTEMEADADHAVVTEICDYVDPNGKRFLSEERRMTFRAQEDSRSIDVDQVFTACDGEVCFADRKDAGLSIRVPVGMAIDSGQGGRVINSEGEMDDDTWSRAAKWCDYHGIVDGEHLGIAFLNHPSSYRFPTRWHVRSYGLFAANPFAMQSYDPSLPDGTTTLQPGEKLKLNHRIIFHIGDASAAGIEKAWQDYAETVKD
ncbi:hypothetical protein FHS27_001551 [Rhodopirellula rubra]|uniref:Secreted protein n=1 Tax=Aporhodopirellula rubra TaxID=980271 RepID=A0A7W5H3X8_9BACT|nr:PmoA family protein [Aporhodopirellula rubra]MBB3205747.1 hypothetical protein [Aporhodopirellula rubra]